MSITSTAPIPRPYGPASGIAVNPSHDHSVAAGTFSTQATPQATNPVPVSHAAVRHDAPTSNVERPSTTATPATISNTDGAIATATATTRAATAVRRTRSRQPSSMIPSGRSVPIARGSAVPMPAARRVMCTNQGTAANATRALSRPVDITPGSNGIAT